MSVDQSVDCLVGDWVVLMAVSSAAALAVPSVVELVADSAGKKVHDLAAQMGSMLGARGVSKMVVLWAERKVEQLAVVLVDCLAALTVG